MDNLIIPWFEGLWAGCRRRSREVVVTLKKKLRKKDKKKLAYMISHASDNHPTSRIWAACMSLATTTQQTGQETRLRSHLSVIISQSLVSDKHPMFRIWAVRLSTHISRRIIQVSDKHPKSRTWAVRRSMHVSVNRIWLFKAAQQPNIWNMGCMVSTHWPNRRA